MTMTLADQAALAVHDGQVGSSRPKRRTFTAGYKARILAEYDALPDGSPARRPHAARTALPFPYRALAIPAGKGDAARDNGKAIAESRGDEELARLRAENKKLKARGHRAGFEPRKTRTALDIAGKAFALLEDISGSATQARTERGRLLVFPCDGKSDRNVRACRILGNHAHPAPEQKPETARAARGEKGIPSPRGARAGGKGARPEELHSPRFADKSVAQAYTILLDEAATSARRPACTGSCAARHLRRAPRPCEPPGAEVTRAARRRAE